ncbi:serine-rich coiled-coil domain-containing protein 2 isoform X2 [Kryptolebias marmoratus]|nr:serine-rich coiled-coil domain-containing protein 2 isoform X2 [Kryptolebias marmoratus]
MEEKAPTWPAMVSRLPKFGGRPSGGGTSPLCNGSTQPNAPAQDGKTATAGARPNGVICSSPFSLKWKRDEGMNSSNPVTATSPGDRSEDNIQCQLPSLVKEVKNSSPATPKMCRSGSLMMAVSSPKAIPKQPLKMSSKGGTKIGQNSLNGVSKIPNNVSSIPARLGSDLRPVRPLLGTGSARSASQDSLSQSNESLKMFAVDNMVRSNSFTHFKQIPSPTNEPMTRSFSFNRTVELAKPLANTQLRPPRSSCLKPPQVSNGRVGLGINGSLGVSGGQGGGIGGLQYSRGSSCFLSNSSVSPAPNTPQALKKPLLPNSVMTKSMASSVGSLGSRLTRFGQTKQQMPIVLDRVKKGLGSLDSSECEGLLRIAKTSEPNEDAGKADSPSESDASSGNEIANGGGDGVLRQSSCQGTGETLEDMSLSSTSSIDRGDTIEEFLDDFDCVEDVDNDGDLPDNQKSDSTAQPIAYSFYNETSDWESKHMTEHKEVSPVEDSQESMVLSPVQGDAPQASSVEMSPSNSSGGTYMWDEEGLEPLGRHETPLDSYDDSELNSMDILNNLNPSEAEDLDDNDLMLDVDLPDDGSHDFERMSHIERPERANRQGQHRKQHRWGGPDHVHSDSRAYVFQNHDGHKGSRASSRFVQSDGRQRGYAPMPTPMPMPTLDELTLEHMTQDCSLLKNQLLRLKTLLELEETDSPTDVSEQSEDSTTVSQIEALIKEVEGLREELKSRDKTIAQLTLQCQQLQQQQHPQEQLPYQGRQVRCQCHHQGAPSSLRQGDRPLDRRVQHHDKATQTYWRPPSHAGSPFALRTTKGDQQFQRGALPTPFPSPWQAQHQGSTRTGVPQRRHTSNTTAFQPLSQRAPPPGKTNKNSPHRGPQ